MSINLDPAWMMSVFLVSLRVAVLLMMSPIFTSLSGLVTVRILFTLTLGMTLVSGMSVPLVAVEMALSTIILAALQELFVGATLAFGVLAAFAAFSLAGEILDIQSGFALGSVYDPVTHGGGPMFATILNMIGVVVFFSIDAHHAFMRGIVFSLQQVPPGAGFDALHVEAVVRQFGMMFSLGVALIIPVLLCLLLLEAGLAVISRVLPQMNVIIVLVPVKLAAGIGLFAMTLPVLSPAMRKIYTSIFYFWEQVLS